MAADATSDAPSPERLVVEVQDSRDIGPVEAEGLLRECLSLTHKRLDTAIWRVLQRLQGEAPEDDEEPLPATAPTPSKLDDTRGSNSTGYLPGLGRVGLRRATARSPAFRPISAGLSRSSRWRALYDA